jgi:hypothetical protein
MRMTRRKLSLADLDAWHGERKLDCLRAPARHAVAAWALAAAIALVAILGPPATRQTVAGLVVLRHDVLMLDRELERVALRTRLAGGATPPAPPAAIAALAPDRSGRA